MKLVAILLLLFAPMICEARSAAVRRAFQREHPCPSTGRRRGSCPGYVADHRIPICKNGPDVPSNLQWQTVEAAKIKDRVECKGRKRR